MSAEDAVVVSIQGAAPRHLGVADITDSLRLPPSETVRAIKEHVHAHWIGRPQVEGIRCVAYGRVLADDEKLSEINSVSPQYVALHVVIRPEAWERDVDNILSSAEKPATCDQPAAPSGTASPSAAPAEQAAGASTGHAEAAGPTEDPLLSSGFFRIENPLLAFVEELAPGEIPFLADAVFVTFHAYTTYLDELLGTHPPDAPQLPPLGAFDFSSAQRALGNPELPTRAVRLVEETVMHWPPLEHIPPEKASAYAPHYEQLDVGGLPFLLRTSKRVPSHTASVLERVVRDRLAFLARTLAMLARLQDFHTWSAPATSTPPESPMPEQRAAGGANAAQQPEARELVFGLTASELVTVLMAAANLLLKVGVLIYFLSSGASTPKQIIVLVLGSLFVVYQVYAILREQRRRRQGSGAQQATSRQEAATTTSSRPDVSTMRAPLELPRLPRPPQERNVFTYDFWVQHLALYGLNEEDEEIGLEHVTARSSTLAIDWEARDWSTPEPPREPVRRKPLLIERVLRPLLLMLVTLFPHLEEARSDAIQLRNDAILALARKWEQREQGRPYHAEPPRILQHPYAQRLLAERQRAEQRAAERREEANRLEG